jgi:GxxExxY protein
VFEFKGMILTRVLFSSFSYQSMDNSANHVSMKYQEITGTVIGCAMKVHRELGAGFQEVIYQRALEIELKKTDLRFNREYEMSIYYSGEKIGLRIVDFFVQNKIMVELKAKTQLEDADLAQALNYLEASGTEICLLINFGASSLQFKRMYNKRMDAGYPQNQ